MRCCLLLNHDSIEDRNKKSKHCVCGHHLIHLVRGASLEAVVRSVVSSVCILIPVS